MRKNPESIQRHNGYVRDYAEKRRDDFKRWLDAQRTPCPCCGESDPACIDFHHWRGTKKFAIGMNQWGRSRHHVEAELTKCIPLCRNCHSKLHAGTLRY